MSDDLAKRLRDKVGMQVGEWPVLIHEAADHIDTLAAERDALRAALNEAEADQKALEYQTERLRLTMESSERALDRAEAAEAERDRLAEQVRVITERSDEVERANAQLARIVLAAERVEKAGEAERVRWSQAYLSGCLNSSNGAASPGLSDTPAAETKKPDSD